MGFGGFADSNKLSSHGKHQTSKALYFIAQPLCRMQKTQNKFGEYTYLIYFCGIKFKHHENSIIKN